MSVLNNIFAFIRIGFINPSLLMLCMRIKRSGRTYLSYSRLYSLIRYFLIFSNRSTGDIEIAEFGVGRGGSAMILAWLVNRYNGRISLFDIFGLIPAPTAIDGERALNRYKFIVNHERNDYYGNIRNLREVVQNELEKICSLDRVEIIQGKYEDILPKLNDNRKFHLVHIDCDWYESSKIVYSYLQTRLFPGAVIQVDDYTYWEGSMRAYHETDFLHNYRTHLIDGALVIDTSKTK